MLPQTIAFSSSVLAALALVPAMAHVLEMQACAGAGSARTRLPPRWT